MARHNQLISKLLGFMQLAVLLIPLPAMAQNHTVKGSVKDQAGEPVVGCVIIPDQASQKAVTSDLDGNYSVEVAPEGALTYSFIGFEEVVEQVAGRAQIDVVMRPQSENLDEAVVVGYGVASKKLVSSSISSLKMDDIQIGADYNPIKNLQGRVPGVSIASGSGIPGSTPNVIVRGVSSISGGSSPLYVVDGIPAESYPNINSDDIASIEVLKDASATAIYGSRANAGVILITTKAGEVGKTQVNASASFGVAQVGHDIPMANREEYINTISTAIDNYNAQMNKFVEMYIPDNNIDFDWMSAISRKAPLLGRASVSVSGGTIKTKFYASIGYEDQQGYLLKTNFSKLTARTKLSQQIAKWLTMHINISGAYSRYDKVEETDGSLKLLRAAREEQPWYNDKLDDGSWRVMSESGLVRHNPVMVIQEEDYYINKYQLQGTLSLDIKPFKGFKYSPSVSGYGIYDKTIKKLTENNTDRGYKDGWHALSEQKDNSFRLVVDNVISYENEWNQLMYSVMAGHSFEKYQYETFGAASDNYANDAYPSSSFDLITSGNQIYAGSIGYNAYALESFFFRGALNYGNRYIVNFSARADGSSRFPKKNRYGFFPAGSVAWIITNEKWMPQNNVLTELKIRASAGQTGSMAGVSNWSAMSLVAAGNPYNGAAGMRVTQIAQDIKWEKATKVDFGADFEFFGGRMTGVFDVFWSRTEDLLYDKPVVSTSGYTSLVDNIGTMDNVGVELTLGGRIIDREVKWDLSGNFSWGKNKLVNLLDGQDIIILTHSYLYGGNKHALITGKPVSTWYMLRMDGIYQDDSEVPEQLYAKGVRAGDVKYFDRDGNGDIDDNDRVECGKAVPDFFGGLTSTLSWKGLELNIMCQYSFGGKIFAAWKGCNAEGIEHLGLSSGSVTDNGTRYYTQWFNVSKYAANNFWRGPGSSNTMPRPVLNGVHTGWSYDYNVLTSTRYLEDASYFKIKNITLAYSLPQKWMDRIRIRGIKFFFTVDNVWTFTKYDGYDPEASVSGNPAAGSYATDFGYEPMMRSFIGGVEFKF